MSEVEGLAGEHVFAAAGAGLAQRAGQQPRPGGLVVGVVAALRGRAAAGVAPCVPCGCAGVAAVVGSVGESAALVEAGPLQVRAPSTSSAAEETTARPVLTTVTVQPASVLVPFLSWANRVPMTAAPLMMLAYTP